MINVQHLMTSIAMVVAKKDDMNHGAIIPQ